MEKIRNDINWYCRD